jgi:ribosome maturation protein SDO1
VQEYRNGVETNLDDVLQIANVFVNVSKGEMAKHQDLQKAFGTTDTDEIVKEVHAYLVHASVLGANFCFQTE